MQDKQTGNMIQINETEAKEASSNGFCVLTKGEPLTLKGENFIVDSFGKRSIRLECKSEKTDFIVGERLLIKSGNFSVKSYGKKFMILNSLPGNNIIDEAVIDEMKKMQIAKMRDETLRNEAIRKVI